MTNPELAYRRNSPGRLSVLKACATAFLSDRGFDPKDISRISDMAYVLPRTVINAFRGYGRKYDEQREGSTKYKGMDCVTKTLTQEWEFDQRICTEKCSNYPDCPLREAFRIKAQIDRKELISQSGNLIVTPRHGSVIAEGEPKPEDAEFGVSFVEFNPEYGAIQAEIIDLVTTGNLGRFQFCEDEMHMDVDLVSRKVTLEHPNYPDRVFNFAVGTVTRNADGHYILDMPDSSRKITDIIPTMSSNSVDPKTGAIRKNTTVEYLGGYDLNELDEKVRMTSEAKKRFGGTIDIPENVACGHYSDIANKPIGLYVYTSPRNIISIDDYYTDALNRIHSNKISTINEGNLMNEIPNSSEIFAMLGELFAGLAILHKQDTVHLQLHPRNWGRGINGRTFFGDFETAYMFRHNGNYTQDAITLAKAFDLRIAITSNIKKLLLGIEGIDNSSLFGIGMAFVEETLKVACASYGIKFDQVLFANNYEFLKGAANVLDAQRLSLCAGAILSDMMLRQQ